MIVIPTVKTEAHTLRFHACTKCDDMLPLTFAKLRFTSTKTKAKGGPLYVILKCHFPPRRPIERAACHLISTSDPPPPQWVGFDSIMTMTYPTTAESHLQLKLMGGVVKDHPILLVVKVYKFLEINEIEIKKSI